MRKSLSTLAAFALLATSTPILAETRPAAATFAIATDDDVVGVKELGWFWAGAGILLGLGILVLASSEPNSPR